MRALADRLGLRTDPTIFFASAFCMVIFVIALAVAPETIGDWFAAARQWIVTNLGWFFILGVNVWLAFLLFAAFSSYGHIRLGSPDARPDYSNLSWFTMLFAGGIGTVLMFWGVAEPISHFSAPPVPGVEPFSTQAADDAMAISIYHLGLHTWTIWSRRCEGASHRARHVQYSTRASGSRCATASPNQPFISCISAVG